MKYGVYNFNVTLERREVRRPKSEDKMFYAAGLLEG